MLSSSLTHHRRQECGSGLVATRHHALHHRRKRGGKRIRRKEERVGAIHFYGSFYVNCWKVKQGLDSIKFEYGTFPDPFRRQPNPRCVIVEDLDATLYRCNLVATTAH
jgi:hypothetical protein